jgi:hypothetical protein
MRGEIPETTGFFSMSKDDIELRYEYERWANSRVFAIDFRSEP